MQASEAVAGTTGRGASPLPTSRRGYRPQQRVVLPPHVAKAHIPTRAAVLAPPAPATSTPPTESVPVHAFVLEQIREYEEAALLPLPLDVENVADDAQLHNPLQRMERLSTGWFGVIMEYEGVVVPDTHDAHVQAWLAVADECGFTRPLGTTLRRIKGVRDDVVVMRVFNWTRNSQTAKKLAERKAELYDALVLAAPAPAAAPETREFLDRLHRYNVPIALACALPEPRVAESLDRLKLRPYFSSVVTAEDSGAAEVEYYYSYAAQLIQRPAARCIVVGESNTSVEAAHELGMKVVIVAGNQPVYNYSSADLVVRSLDQVSFINMKKLFSNEDLVQSRRLEDDDSNVSSSSDSGGAATGAVFGRGAAFGRDSEDSFDQFDYDDYEEEERQPLPRGAAYW